MQIKMWREILIPYQQAVQEMAVKFESIVNENSRLGKYSPIEYVTTRVKKISSILEKAQMKGVAIDRIEEEIEDIAGVRIICQFVEDIDKVVELIRSRNDMTIKFEKDYISNTKQSGYRSYHMIVYYNVHTALGEKKIQAEIQIRTLAMNFWATIEHSIQYKYKGDVPSFIQNRLVHAAEAAHQLDNEMSKIRTEVLDAQSEFRLKSNIIADILNNIQNLKGMDMEKDALEQIQDHFFKLWERNDIGELEEYSRQLDEISAVHRAQSLG